MLSLSNKPTTVCVLTPAGRGAIAVVSVDGAEAVELVEPLFTAASGRRLGEVPLRRIAFGRWSGEPGEEVVITRLEGRVEVHCHGGVAASRAIVDSLVAAGCKAVEQRDWLAGRSKDKIAAAAHEMLGRVQTEKAALVLLDQLNGGLAAEIERIATLVDHEPAKAREALHSLRDRWSLGQRLTRPARVVLTGPPNVGKSSLINALVGYERAIVFDQPGTTRDLVTATTAIDGWAVELVDTAGLRLATSGVEQAGIELAREAIAAADLVLRVDDARTWIAGEPAATEFDAWTAGKTMVEVANKVDLLTPAECEQLADRANECFVLTAATTRLGIDDLLARIANVVVPAAFEVGAAVPFTDEQVRAINGALIYLASGDGIEAKRTLLAML
ncbi:GTPase [Aeoliella sp. SH292]|uniref:GTPase n=1 Tax=Aeoliella sp. SH292 TaxID=3454464 RepID=UPI003F9D4C65